MPTVKRVFSIPNEISIKLDENIPNQARSKFVTKTLAKALQEINREKLLKMLDELEPWETEENDKPVVEVLRKIREAESKRITDDL